MSDVKLNDYDSYIEDLEKKLLESKNLILSGPPGTGKTYLAKLIANRIVGKESDAVITNDGPVRFVQFHPSYDYTDFVEGLRPVNSSDSNDNSGSKSISFERKDGLFKRFCKDAIDAINNKIEQHSNISFSPIENETYKEELLKEIEDSLIRHFTEDYRLSLSYSFYDIKVNENILRGTNSCKDIASNLNDSDMTFYLHAVDENNQELSVNEDDFLEGEPEYCHDEDNTYRDKDSFFRNKGLVEIRIKNFFEDFNPKEGIFQLHPYIKSLISFFLFQSDLLSAPDYLIENKNKYIDDMSKQGFRGRTSQNFPNSYALYVLVIFDFVKKFKEEEKIPLYEITNKIQPSSLQKYVFIIDEINRGDLGKIFGELFYSIDPDYRGESGRINTQYQNLIEEDDCFSQGFYVPDNVYIIGTMNDIDRSVESMDFAIRRRFTFVEVPVLDDKDQITPQELKILDSIADISDVEREKIKASFISLNKKIKDTIGLGKSYQIGASYFKSLKKRNGLINYDEVWNFRLKPLLKEYLRGRPNLDEQLKELKVAYDTEY